MPENRTTISDLIMNYFQSHAKQDIPHGPVVDWVTEQYQSLYGKTPRDPWREIRRLYQVGTLIKVKKGVYRYDPDKVRSREIYDFPADIKEQIFQRDNYRCIVCNRGREDGVEIHADHRIPIDKGGSNELNNGQTLCSEHNLLKKNYSQTEFGKRLVNRLYQEALSIGDTKMINFCRDIFEVYDKYELDKHIPRADYKLTKIKKED